MIVKASEMVLSGIGPCDQDKYCDEIRKEETAKILIAVEKSFSERARCLIRLAGSRTMGKSCFLHYIAHYISEKHGLLWIPLPTHRLGSFSQIHGHLVHFLVSKDFPYVLKRFRDNAPDFWNSRRLVYELLPEEKHEYIDDEIYRAFDRLMVSVAESEINPFLLHNAVRTIQPFLDALLINLYCLMNKFKGVLLTLDDVEHCWRAWPPLQRMRFWKCIVDLANTTKPPLVLCLTADNKLVEDVDDLREHIRDSFANVEDVYLRDLSVSDIEVICERYLNGADKELKELILSRIRNLKMFSVRTVLQVLYALSFSVGWQKTQASALEVAQRILTERDKLLHRKLVDEMKKTATNKFGVKPSDKEIVLSVKWPKDKETLERILESLPSDLDAAIEREIANWFKQKDLFAALEKVKSSETCPWCKYMIKPPLAYNFLTHLRWCPIASTSTNIMGYREYEIDALLKRLK
jgi:hypothetical protein